MSKASRIVLAFFALAAFAGAGLVAWAIPTMTPENVGMTDAQGLALFLSMAVWFAIAGGLFAGLAIWPDAKAKA